MFQKSLQSRRTVSKNKYFILIWSFLYLIDVRTPAVVSCARTKKLRLWHLKANHKTTGIFAKNG